jgi:hypothetical protein
MARAEWTSTAEDELQVMIHPITAYEVREPKKDDPNDRPANCQARGADDSLSASRKLNG